ncbi:MAG: mechanosensitive ion channel domain-containing protein [Candidatus Woesearchaeota archaeon]
MDNSTILVDEANVALSILNPLILRIVIAILIFLMGFVIGKIVQRLILGFFKVSDLERIFRKKTGIKIPIATILATIASYFIYIVAIVMALNRLAIATPLIVTIVILLIIILVLFVIFGMNDIFGNLTAGIMIRFRKNIKPGDYIRIKDKNIEGYIISMNTLSMRLETKKDEIVFIPNMAVFRSEIVKPKKVPKT